jgi:hypothetical protein
MNVVLITFPAFLLALSVAAGQQSEAPKPEDVQLPVSVKKIQKAISRPPAIQTKSDRPTFRVEVFSRKPTIEDILGKDYLIGPVSYGGMTHQEFLNMVTPVEYRGYSMFTNKEGMTIAATSLALQWGLMKAIDKLKEAKDARAQEAARREVLDAMNELDKARQKAGLSSVKQP